MPVDAAGTTVEMNAPAVEAAAAAVAAQVEVAEAATGTVAAMPVDAAGIIIGDFARPLALTSTLKTMTTTLTMTSMMKSS